MRSASLAEDKNLFRHTSTSFSLSSWRGTQKPLYSKKTPPGKGQIHWSFLNFVENTVVHQRNLLEKWGTIHME